MKWQAGVCQVLTVPPFQNIFSPQTVTSGQKLAEPCITIDENRDKLLATKRSPDSEPEAVPNQEGL